MSFLCFPNVFGLSNEEIHIYLFPTIKYEPNETEFRNALDCFLSNFEYPRKFKAQVLYGSNHTEQLSKPFITSDFKDISENIWRILNDKNKPWFSRFGLRPRRLKEIHPFDDFNESFIYIRIFDESYTSPEDPYTDIINTKSSMLVRILYSQLRLAKQQPGIIKLDHFATIQMLEFRKEFVPEHNSHLEFEKLEIPDFKRIGYFVDPEKFRKEPGILIDEKEETVNLSEKNTSSNKNRLKRDCECVIEKINDKEEFNDEKKLKKEEDIKVVIEKVLLD